MEKNKFMRPFAITAISMFGLLACNSDSLTSTNPSTVTPETPNTVNVLCDVQNSGEQNVVYTNFDPQTNISTSVNEFLNYSYSWVCNDENRVLSANGIPNHATTGGEFASKISVQTVSATIPLAASLTTSSTNVKEPGYAINGIKLDPATAGTCPDTATDASNCDPGGGTGSWRMVALGGDVSPWKFGFGTDSSNAHVQPGGTYHYHGIPEELLPKLNSASNSSMTLTGWANDGFPIYARYGYRTASDANSGLVAMSSSYRTKDTPDAGRPSVDNFPMGHFESDWEYVAGSGDLDDCNGRTGVTPEYPNGTYHYYMTDSYPYLSRCLKGEVAAGPGGPPPR